MKAVWMVCMFLSSAAIAGTEITCPHDYPIAQLSARPPSGWQGIAHVPGQWATLSSAGVIAGSPLQWAQATQMGEETRTSKGVQIKFHDLNKFTEPQPKWVYCKYGTDPGIQLIKRVPDNVDVCVADIQKRGQSVTGITVVCH